MSELEKELPEFDSLDKLVDFFDTNDMSEYFDKMPEAQFDVRIKKRTFLVSVDKELIKKLSRLAEAQQTTTEALVRSWLEEKAAAA